MKNKIGYIVSLILLIIFFIWMFNDYNIKKNSIQEIEKTLTFNNEELVIRLYSNKLKEAKKVLNEVEKIYKEYNDLITNEEKNIENIYYLNNLPLTTTTLIDSKLYELIKYGVQLYDLTDGYININTGYLNKLWNSYYNKGVPSETELKNVNTNIKNVVLLDNNTIKQNGFNIDLSYIAVSYVTDIVVTYLKENNFYEYLIKTGGFTFTGNHYNNNNYKIGLLSADDTSISDIISVTNKVVVTIDNKKDSYTYNNINYHSIIDPKTLYPAKSKSLILVTSNIKYSSAQAYALFMSENKKYLTNDDACMWYKIDKSIIKSDLFSSYLE